MARTRIVVIDDDPKNLKDAVNTVIAAGHIADAHSHLGTVTPDVIAAADGIITDLYFHPRSKDYDGYGDFGYYDHDDDNDIAKIPLPPAGVFVVIDALYHGKPVVVCTSGDHHGPDLNWIYDCYIVRRSISDTLPFGWDDKKDWANALALLIDRMK